MSRFACLSLIVIAATPVTAQTTRSGTFITMRSADTIAIEKYSYTGASDLHIDLDHRGMRAKFLIDAALRGDAYPERVRFTDPGTRTVSTVDFGSKSIKWTGQSTNALGAVTRGSTTDPTNGRAHAIAAASYALVELITRSVKVPVGDSLKLSVINLRQGFTDEWVIRRVTSDSLVVGPHHVVVGSGGEILRAYNPAQKNVTIALGGLR